VVLTINGERHYLWRAVDQDGHVLDLLVQHRRDKRAAKKFFRMLPKGLTYVPRVIISDQLKRNDAAKREILPGVEHRRHRSLNNRAENSHQPTRQRERRLQPFKSLGTPNASSQPTVPSLRISDRAATCFLPPSPAKKWPKDFSFGGR
jgi:putative transposase